MHIHRSGEVSAMRWVESCPGNSKNTFRPSCTGKLVGYALMAAGILLIFLCVPFHVWMILLGIALIVTGYWLAFGR